ncbi:MAG: CpaF family protein [Methanobrevibacter sp.]|jgi:flagellar protein FlaI|nr:CpaF family protein [Candidatus Methanovirga procula]
MTNKNNQKNYIKEYKVTKPNFSQIEEKLLKELRNELVNLAISSGNDFNLNKKALIQNIKNFIDLKLPLSNVDLNSISPNRSLKSINNSEKDNLKNGNEINIYEDDRYKNENLKRDTYLNDLTKKFYQEITGYGSLDPLIKDDDLEEIMIIGVRKPVFIYHRDLGMMETNLIFKKEEDILTLIDTIARQINRRIDQESPILDGRLLDGSRVNATISPISADEPSLTIRKFKKDPLTIIDLIKLKTMNTRLGAFLWLCVDGLGVKPANIIISGGTSSGKTTTLNSLTNFINPRERLISIEDTLELQINHQHLLRMETRPKNIEQKGELTMDDLVKNALRQRPDRIIVGEVRGTEAITLFTALNTGHSGFGTLHANSSRETITRLINHPMNVPKIMISAIDLIIMENRIYRSDGVSIRRITEISEVVGIEKDNIQLNKIFNWNPKTDEIENIGITSKTLRNISETRGTSMKEIEEEITNREILLKYLLKNNLRTNEKIGEIFKRYYRDKDEILDEVKGNY